MSGTPNKRLHDDHSRYPPHTQDDSGGMYSNSKLPNPSVPVAAGAGAGAGAASFDIGQDSRMPKVPRTDLDTRRSPMLQMYRMQQPPPSSSSLNDSQIDHTVNNPDDRVESRDNNVGNIKAETRDVKAESKELLYQNAKIDKDVRYANRGDDHKDAKYERDLAYSEYRNEPKTDKDSYNPVNSSHVNWKDSKEHTRAWKYPDTAPSGGNLEQWHASRASNMDVASKNLVTEAKDHTDVKVDDRDRKRKDGKHREWGENSKERTEIRNNEMKDPTKEERDTDRKDLVKDKDKTRDSKDHTKREPWIGNEKEGLQNEKEDMDISSSKSMDHEEQKKQKTAENWKDLDKEAKDKRMEKDIDKDSDDGGADVEGSTDREREAFNHGVQQRKRMLRPRGSPQVANRDPRFRSRPQDNDGSTGKADVSTVVYRVGECMQELIKLWKEYESSISDQMSESSKTGPTLEIRIPAEHVSATNRQVKGGQLWGTDIYTDDSDLVAVLMHTGYCRPTASPPPPAIQELRATVRVLPPQDCYVSTLRNNVRSRAWGAAIGCSFRVERCYIVKKGGGTIDLEACLTHTSTVEPTLAPVVVERTMTTRAAASNALRQQRFVREVTLQYNLCNEPWIKYSISAIADKGLKKPLFTSARLKKGEVLYLESRTRRYELCFNGEKMVKATAGNDMEVNGVESDNNNNNGNSNLMDIFRWSECKKPLPQTVMRSIGIPMPPEHLQVLEENLDWEDIQWSQTGVWISGKEYPLSRVHFLSPV